MNQLHYGLVLWYINTITKFIIIIVAKGGGKFNFPVFNYLMHTYYNNFVVLQVSQITGVDENTPPPLPIFDKIKYKFPTSKKIQIPETMDTGNIYAIVMKYLCYCNDYL